MKFGGLSNGAPSTNQFDGSLYSFVLELSRRRGRHFISGQRHDTLSSLKRTFLNVVHPYLWVYATSFSEKKFSIS